MSIRLSLYDIKSSNVFKGMLKNIFNVYRRVNTTCDECNHVLIAHTYNGMYHAECILLVIVLMSHNFESCNLNIYEFTFKKSTNIRLILHICTSSNIFYYFLNKLPIYLILSSSSHKDFNIFVIIRT